MANSYYIIFFIIILLLFFFNFFELFEDVNDNKEFIIYFTREEYLPLYLFIHIFENILINNNYKVTKVKNIDQNTIKSNVYFIIFGIELNDSIMDFLIENKIKTIMINTEYYTLFNVMDKINKLHDKIDLYVLDSSTINIIKIKSLIQNIKIIHLPLLNNKYLVEF